MEGVLLIVDEEPSSSIPLGLEMIQDASLLFPWGEVVTRHYVALYQGVWETDPIGITNF